MSVALLPTSCRSFCSFSSDLLKNKQKHASGNGKGMKRQDARSPAFPNDNPPLSILMSRACFANHFGAAEALPIQLFHQAWTEVSPQGPSGFDFNHQKKFYVHSTWVQRFGTKDHTIIQTWLPGTSEGSYENTSWRLHTLFHIILYVGFKLASLSTATAWRSFKAPKKSKASRFVSSLACCLSDLSAWKSLPGSEMSDPLQSGAKILHFRPPSRVQSAAPAPEMHNVTHWKNRTVYFQLWQLIQVQRKNSSAKRKNVISSPLACHLDPFVKL